MNHPTIISLGEVLWDVFPDGERFGGAPANFACHAAILGGDVSMVSAVGDDRHGSDAISILRGYGIDVSLMQTIPDAPTGTVGVTLDPNGKPSFSIHENSAWDRLAWSDNLASRVTQVDAVYFGTLGQRSPDSRNTIRTAVQTAAQAGVPRVLDINLRPPFCDASMIRDSVQLASILKLSDEELSEVCAACGIDTNSANEEAIQQLLEKNDLSMVVMTRGADGAVLTTSQGTISQLGLPANVRDTVGAGDSFTAAFVLGLLGGEKNENNLRRACEIAAATCSHSGAVPNHSMGPSD